MLMTLGFTILIFSIAILGLSIGWIVNKKPLKGSCGGLNAIGLNGECKICGAKNPATECREGQQ